SVDAVDSADVLEAIKPIWLEKPDMARKTLARIRRVFDWATLKRYRDVSAGNVIIARPNPCAGIHSALQKQPSAGHHAGLPYHDLPTFIQKWRASSSGDAVKLALELTILTCLRTSEVIEAEWIEFDLDAKLWTVPAARMKMEREHKVPLSDRCLEILSAAK